MSMTQKTKVGMTALALAALTGCCRPQLEVVEDGAAVIVRGARAELRVEDGRITSLKGPDGMAATGDVREKCGRVGLGVMVSAHETSYLHCPFVSPIIDQNRVDDRKKSFRSPDAKSVRTVARGEGKVTIRWQGLSDGATFHPDDTLVVEFGTDAHGAITMQTRGRSPKGGVFGVQLPIENLKDDGAFVLPFVGGLRFKIADMKKGVWSLFCDFLYCQAPVAAIETPRGSFGVWSEDDQFNQYQAYFPKGEKTAAFAWEWLTLMPFELQKEVASPVMKIDAFSDCDWLGAATPYRNWYRERFKEEIAIRDRTTNPETSVLIGTSWDRGYLFDDHLDTLTNMFGRALGFNYGKMTLESTLPPNRFDWLLPGHTPDTNRYAKAVAERQKRGIPCACYSVAYCLNYDSPAFKRDKVNEFALPTLNCAYQYRPLAKEAVAAVKDQTGADEAQALSTMNNTLRAVKTDVTPWDTPAEKWRKMKFKDQELVYLDMNSKRWRDYIVGVHKHLFDTLGLQAFYSDCLGVIRDTGNGVIDGTSAATGSYLLGKELQKLGRPFTSECGSAPIGMFVSYAHQSADFMREKKQFMEFRFHNSVPLCTYLFGYRSIAGGLEAHRSAARNFVACACSDALGGMGNISHPPWNTVSGIGDHLVVRSLVFARKCLKPYFPNDGHYPAGVTCMYRDRDGGIYRYCGEGPVQVMYGPDGKPLWGRAFGATEFDVPGLELPGWPMRKGSRHYGLTAENYYALFPVKDGGPDLAKTYGTIPESEKLVLAYGTPDFTYLELAGRKPKVTFKVKETTPEVSRVISRQSGIETLGQERKIAEAEKFNLKGGIKLFRVEGPDAFRTIDFVHTVKKGEAVRLFAQNREWGTWDSNGCLVGIYVNGERQVEYDSAPAKNPKWAYQQAKRYLYDYRMHKFTAPLDKWAGQTVLVSIRIDDKNVNYDDHQDISMPEIVPYAGEPLDEVLKGYVPESAYRYFNGGEPVRE